MEWIKNNYLGILISLVVSIVAYFLGNQFWTFNCESCMNCMSNCPNRAIETGHGYIGAFIYVFMSVLMGLFNKYFGLWFFTIENSLLKMLIESALFVAFMGIWYRILHWLLRFKIFERLIVYTSLTKYKWWGQRYKAMKPDSLEDSNIL